jgi:hypothetical protein
MLFVLDFTTLAVKEERAHLTSNTPDWHRSLSCFVAKARHLNLSLLQSLYHQIALENTYT